MDTKRECEENSLDVESEAEVKNRKAKQSKGKALKIFIHLSLWSAEPSLQPMGSKSRDGGYRIPRFSSAPRCMSELHFSLGKLCDQPMPFAVRLYKSKIYRNTVDFLYEQSCLVLLALSQNVHNEKMSINPLCSFVSLLPHR